jgi:uncharacterized protein YyaL (SSP411 family)
MESEDSFGRAVWGLGCVLGDNHLPDPTKRQARTILKKTLKWIPELNSLRAIAFSIIGLSYIAQLEDSNLYDENQINEIKKLVKKLADKLVRTFDKHNKNNGHKWAWFEDFLTYSNYKLPESLFRAYSITRDKSHLRVAEESIKFLIYNTFEKQDQFSPIGQDGWYFRNGKRAYFDQQPEDTATAVEALLAAYNATNKKYYLNKAKHAFNWFLGKNHLNQMVYDEATGGCYDGLGKYSLNFNQGAESSISYLLARLAMERVTR